MLVTPRREVGRADCGCSLWLQARKSTGRHIDPDQPRRADRRARRTGAQGGCDVLTPSAREAASRRPECHGRSSCGSSQLRAASRPALASVIPSRGGTSPGSPSFPHAGLGSRLASVARRGPEPLLQDRLPLFGAGYPKKGQARDRDVSSFLRNSVCRTSFSPHVFCFMYMHFHAPSFFFHCFVIALYSFLLRRLLLLPFHIPSKNLHPLCLLLWSRFFASTSMMGIAAALSFGHVPARGCVAATGHHALVS